MSDLILQLYENILQTTVVEFIAVFFGLVSVIYAARNSVLVFPTGIISVLLYVYICFKWGLYADMIVNAFYFIMSLFGWYNWIFGSSNNDELQISKTTIKQILIYIVLFFIFFSLLYFGLIFFTDSNVPVLDSITTSLFIIAMWLMALRKLENWIFYIVGNAISIPLYIYKGLILTSFQYMVFLVIAIVGFIQWQKIIKQYD